MFLLRFIIIHLTFFLHTGSVWTASESRITQYINKYQRVFNAEMCTDAMSGREKGVWLVI
jgi:hypothetical protein